MKKYSILLILSLVFALSSCSKDDTEIEGDERVKFTIVGTVGNVTSFYVESNQVLSDDCIEYLIQQNGYIGGWEFTDNTVKFVITDPEPITVRYMKNNGLKFRIQVKKQSNPYTLEVF